MSLPIKKGKKGWMLTVSKRGGKEGKEGGQWDAGKKTERFHRYHFLRGIRT